MEGRVHAEEDPAERGESRADAGEGRGESQLVRGGEARRRQGGERGLGRGHGRILQRASAARTVPGPGRAARSGPGRGAASNASVRQRRRGTGRRGRPRARGGGRRGRRSTASPPAAPPRAPPARPRPPRTARGRSAEATRGLQEDGRVGLAPAHLVRRHDRVEEAPETRAPRRRRRCSAGGRRRRGPASSRPARRRASQSKAPGSGSRPRSRRRRRYACSFVSLTRSIQSGVDPRPEQVAQDLVVALAEAVWRSRSARRGRPSAASVSLQAIQWCPAESMSVPSRSHSTPPAARSLIPTGYQRGRGRGGCATLCTHVRRPRARGRRGVDEGARLAHGDGPLRHPRSRRGLGRRASRGASRSPSRAGRSRRSPGTC